MSKYYINKKQNGKRNHTEIVFLFFVRFRKTNINIYLVGKMIMDLKINAYKILYKRNKISDIYMNDIEIKL